MGNKKGETTKGEKERALVKSMQALDFRCAGMSFAEIANQLGVSRSTAFNYVQRILGARVMENEHRIAELRELENRKLDMLWMKVFPNVFKARQNQNGMVSMTDDFVKALNACLRISARRARLNGFDAPPKAPVDKDGNAVPPELKQTIKVLALLNQKAPEAFDKFVEVTTVPPGENGTAKKKTKRIQKTKE